MASWTPDHSRILSQLLDEVVGTPEMIAIRQDFCRLYDCFRSIKENNNVYFTGSAAEGLALPGSDKDYMIDINEERRLKVIQSLDESPNMSPYSVFLMCTNNVPPGFALLQHVNQNTTMDPLLYAASQSMYGLQYLSGDLLMQLYLICKQNDVVTGAAYQRQGPSVETWTAYSDKSESGDDHVPSIKCNFWPNEAAEWIHRPRHFDWPTSFDISSITEFGCHLVPVGHPLSDMKSMEWRISFSLAERALVWSFNHIQMQCYAVMKIILKEFVKVRCNPQNQVLCSYFIKTFLFWKYEEIELIFWRADNLRECIKYLLYEFSQCLREGVLRHYFIPKFNLLSIKLTRAAQIELLQLFDNIIESDIRIFKDCRTLQNIWIEFLEVRVNWNNVACNIRRRNMLMNDMCMMEKIDCLKSPVFSTLIPSSFENISTVFCKTPIKTILLRLYLFQHNRLSFKSNCGPGNRGDYQLYRITQNDTLSFDISTCKLWCAISLYLRGDCSSSLNIVNKVLSSIPPYVTFWPVISNESKQLYVDMFLDSGTTVIQRARKAWMFHLFFKNDMTDSLPNGIQIELYFSDSNLNLILSPFTCAYYLQFLCYHKMCQYDRRDRALRQLIEVADNPEQYGFPITTWNIAGHCLLLAGRPDQARGMFYKSYAVSKMRPPLDKYNSALWYLLNFC